ncbi:MAG: virulence protein RhuM/Fic/DOC family protein [Candidatus Saccharibacteria bacterium]|nr:virulence protein RhuM/Fic/DOC family protein [Candidatus Saccharibacteria bacterium]
MNEVEIYKLEKGEILFNVDKNSETIWASIDQIANLFNVTRRSIEIHIKNIFEEGELLENRTAKDSFVVRREGTRDVRRKLRLYNLDAIISIGYRVNSKKATDFRIWATTVLKSYLTTGLVVNERRLSELDEKKLREVETMMDVVRRLIAHQSLTQLEASGVLEIISKYGTSFKMLQEYSDGFIDLSALNVKNPKLTRGLEALACDNLITELKKTTNSGELFGEPKNGDLEKTLNEIQDSNHSDKISERAAHLLYGIIKSRPFLDGNDRIAALFFIVFLTINNYHLTKNGETKISDRALTALILLIAESEPKEKDLIISLIIKLLDE